MIFLVFHVNAFTQLVYLLLLVVALHISTELLSQPNANTCIFFRKYGIVHWIARMCSKSFLRLVLYPRLSLVSRHCRRKPYNGIRSRKVSSYLITRLCDSSALFWEGVSYAMSSYQFWWFIPILLIPILMIQIFFWIYWSKKFYLPIKWLNYWSKEYNTDQMIK